MSRKKLHMIGNAHLDPVWLWRWQEGFHEAKALFRSALDRMNENEDFYFTCSSSMFFEWVEENNPAMFEEIKRRVAEGRLEITGGWVIQPDCNIPCGEAFVRHGLYGQRYFLSRFNKAAVTGYNVDSFGHSGSLPQILLKSGLKNYVFMRPMPNEKALPSRVFNWESADGSQLLAYRIPYEYNSVPGALDAFLERLKAELLEDIDELMFFYGVGNHGGGPTKENIKSIRALGGNPENPEMIFSTTEAFFENVRKSGVTVPVVRDNLQHHAVGCYSAHSGVKRLNRIAENNLITAERICSIAKIVEDQKYPRDFERGWKSVLFNQFHDTLAGTSLISAYDDAAFAFGEAISIAQRNLNNGLQAISWDIDIEQDETMKPIVVMNPHAWAGKMAVEIEARGIDNKSFRLTDNDGNAVRTQLVQSESVTGQRRLLFVADLPAMGYAVYKLYVDEAAPHEFSPVPASDCMLENERFKLQINPASGYIASLFDKENSVEFIKGEAARLCIMEDKSDTWSHDIYRYDDQLCEMRPVSVKLLEHGAVRSAIRVKYRYQDSVVTQDFRMYSELDHIEVAAGIHWHEPLTCLKVKFPVNVNFYTPTCELPYGYSACSVNGDEEPGQTWIDISGECANPKKLCGLAVANDSKYSYSFEKNEMSVTLLRNPPFAHHIPAVLDAETEYRYVDDGFQSVTYALLPHMGTWKESRIVQVANEINIRPVSLFETYHKGKLPQREAFVGIDKPQVVLTALKEAEDGDGVILRAYETLKQHTDVVMDLRFMNRTLKLHFAPCEIKTVKIPYDQSLEPVEVNMLELTNKMG